MPDGSQINAARYAITYFANQFAQEKWQHSHTLAELAAVIRETSKPDKASLPWLKLATFGDTRTLNNCLRHNANVTATTGLEGDFDGGSTTFDQAVARIREARVKAVVYETPSSTDAAPHWRILTPFSAPLEPDRRAELMDRVNGLVGGGLAPESWVLSQAYYFGSTTGQPVRVEVIDGPDYDYIDRRPDIVSIANPNATKKQNEPNSGSTTAAEGPEGDPVDLAAYIEQIGNDDRPWVEWNSVLMALYAASGGSSLGEQLAIEWSAKATKHVAGEVEKRWKHFRTSPPTRIGAGMLRRMARDAAWITTVASWGERLGAASSSTAGEFGGEPFGTSARAEDTEPFLMTETEIFAMPDPVMLVEGFLMERENVCLVAPPKSGKTFAALDTCLSIAAGLPVLETLKTYRQGPVVYLTGEGSAGFKRRIKAWRQYRKIPADVKLPFYFKAAVPMTAAGATEARRYVDGIRGQGGEVVLVVIDTMARSLGVMDENAAASAAAYLNLTEEIRKGLDCTMLTLAHASNKDRTGKKEVQTRGSSGFDAGFDSVWILDKGEGETQMMKPLYMKEGSTEDFGPHYFVLVPEYVEGMAYGKGAILKMVTLKEWYGSGETTIEDSCCADLAKAMRGTGDREFTRYELATYLIERGELRGPTGEPGVFDPQKEKHLIAREKKARFLENKLRARRKDGKEVPGFFAEFIKEHLPPGGGNQILQLWRLPERYRYGRPDDVEPCEWTVP